MQFVDVPSRVVLCFATLWCVSSGGVLAAQATPKSYPLIVDPIPAVTREHHIRVEGHAAPKQQVTIAGGAAAAQTRADSHGEFHAEISLTRDQTNTLQVSTTEPAATLSLTIAQDSTAPQLVIDSPREDALVYRPRVQITGHVTDNLSGVTAVNCGNSAASVSGTQFTCEMPVGDHGGHRIKVWSSDAAGNVAVVHRRVVSGPPLSGGDAHTVTVTADIDGAHNIDVVRTDFASGEIVIQLGNGDGTFQAEKRVPVGPYPSSLAVADVNRDGILDLVTTHYTAGEAAIQYGQPDGSYVQGPRFRVGMWPSAVAVADVDKDGKLDLITAHLHDGGLVRVHLGRADGSSDAETTVEVGRAPQALAVGDVHGDGKQDIVVANYLSNDVSLLRGRGNGHFYSERRIDLNASAVGPTAITLTDIDRDGALDIATANFGSNDVTVLNGLGQGRFKAAQAFAADAQPIAVVALEVTGDDKLDLVIANLGSSALSVLPGKAGDSFAALEPLRSRPPAVSPMPPKPEISVVVSDPTIPVTPQAADLPSAMFPVTRVPAAGLPAPMDRIGMSFGGGSSDYPFLMGPNGMSYVPLITMGRAGVRWIRLEGDAGHFLPGRTMTYESISKTVDDLIARGYNVHIVVSDLRDPYPSDFPNEQYLATFAQHSAALAKATHRPGRVVFEVWNEPNLLGSFWPPQREGVNEAFQFAKMLTRITEAIHTAAPGSVVMAGGIFTYAGSYMTDLLAEYNRLRVNRPLALVDRFALHPYPFVDGFDILTRFRNDLKAGGMGTPPIYISEMSGWWTDRDHVGAWNANNLLRALEDDLPYINFWGALSSTTFDALGGFMDPAQSVFSSCMQSVYGAIPDTPGYMCNPSMYMLSTFKRVAQGRTYQGALFDARTHSLPNTVPGDPLSGMRALKFESDDDIVIAAYTIDRPRGTIPTSGQTYSIAFPEKPIYVSTYSGQDASVPDRDGRYWITHDRGPLYFFFSKSGQLPTETVSAQAVCADGSLPRRGRLQIYHTAWPYNGPSSVLNWLTPGPSDAARLMTVSDQLPLFVSNMYVYAEVADGSGRALEVRSGVLTQGGPGTPKVVIHTQFNPPTPMIKLEGPSVGSGLYRAEFLALPEWCTP